MTTTTIEEACESWIANLTLSERQIFETIDTEMQKDLCDTLFAILEDLDDKSEFAPDLRTLVLIARDVSIHEWLESGTEERIPNLMFVLGYVQIARKLGIDIDEAIERA